jgi:tetratricopeptide (TPR) repeat protein
MARVIVTAILVIMLNCLVGCRPADSGASQLLAPEVKAAQAVKPSSAGETDLVEKVASNRQAYRNALNTLIAYYEEKGDTMKLRWAKDEQVKLDGLPQYNYIIEATVAPENLKPIEAISEADFMFREAIRLEKDAGGLPILKDENKLRNALELYNKLIKKYPKSDKIDDAAYHAAGIYEYFRDYTIAVLYYKRAFQWDSKTPYPARFKAADILDRHLDRRDEALELYKQARDTETLNSDQKEDVEIRIRELSKGQ